MAHCTVKFLNSAPGEVITHIGVKFTYDDGSVSYDPSNLPTNGLKEVNIPHGEAGYCFGQENKCCKSFWFAETWTHGSGSDDSGDAGAGYCWANPTVELSPSLLAAEGAKQDTFEFVVQNPKTGATRRIAVTLSEEARKAIGVTSRR